MYHFILSFDKTRILVFKACVSRPTEFVDVELDEVAAIVSLARKQGFM